MPDSKSNPLLPCEDHVLLDVRPWMEEPKGNNDGRRGRKLHHENVVSPVCEARGRVLARGSKEIRVSPCMTCDCPEGDGDGDGATAPLATCGTLRVEDCAGLAAEAGLEAMAADESCREQCPVGEEGL